MPKKLTMPIFSPKHPRSYNVRSVSFPARSHPNIQRIEQELNKLGSYMSPTLPNAETVRVRLCGLGEIYRCIEDLLNLSLTKQSLSRNQEDQWVVDTLDDLISFIDVCSNTRDAILVMKETARELQSSLRRSLAGTGELSFESDINAYICCRKKMKKEAAKFHASLKQNDNGYADASEDHYLSAIVKVVKEANWVSISAFSSLLLFLSSPILKSKTRKWAMIWKLVRREAAVACESQQEKMNEIERVDVALNEILAVIKSGKELELQKIECAQKMLEIMDMSIEELENELECLFRRLIHTRVSLLNIVSHQFESC